MLVTYMSRSPIHEYLLEHLGFYIIRSSVMDTMGVKTGQSSYNDSSAKKNLQTRRKSRC